MRSISLVKLAAISPKVAHTIIRRRMVKSAGVGSFLLGKGTQAAQLASAYGNRAALGLPSLDPFEQYATAYKADNILGGLDSSTFTSPYQPSFLESVADFSGINPKLESVAGMKFEAKPHHAPWVEQYRKPWTAATRQFTTARNRAVNQILPGLTEHFIKSYPGIMADISAYNSTYDIGRLKQTATTVSPWITTILSLLGGSAVPGAITQPGGMVYPDKPRGPSNK